MSTTTNPKNPKLKVGTIKAGTHSEHSEEEAREKRSTARAHHIGVLSRSTDRVAGDKLCIKNQPIPKSREWFPLEWKMQFADLFYPYAKDGPLYIDQPGTLHDVALCERKLRVLREKGIRYTYMKSGEAEMEMNLRLSGQDPDKVKADQAALRSKEIEARA
jgi:hypothetical protein